MLEWSDLSFATIEETSPVIQRIEILNFSSCSAGINNACTVLKSETPEDQSMAYEKAANPTAPVEPTSEEDWGEDWGDVTAPTPDINEQLEMFITEYLMSGAAEARVPRS